MGKLWLEALRIQGVAVPGTSPGYVHDSPREPICPEFDCVACHLSWKMLLLGQILSLELYQPLLAPEPAC